MRNLNKLLPLLFVLLSSVAVMAQNAVKAQKDQYFPISSQSEEAKQTFREALNLLWNARTQEYIVKSDEAIRLDPQFFMAHANRAIAEATFENGDSEKFIQKTLALPQENLSPAERILRRVVVALKDNKPDEMKKHADELIREYPNSTQSYSLAIAIARNFTKNTDEAYGYAKRLLEINPNHGPTWNQIGYYHLEKGDLAQAKVAFDNYMRLNPDEANTHDSMGDYYLAANDYNQAANHFDKAVAMGMSSSQERAEKARQMAQNKTDRPMPKAGMESTKDKTAESKGWDRQSDGIDRQTSGIDRQTGANQKDLFLPVSSTSQTAIKTYHDAITRIDHADVKAYHEKLNQAVKEDPGFFMAHAHLALSSSIDARNDSKFAEKSRELSGKVLALPQQSLTPAERIIREMIVKVNDGKEKEIQPLCDRLIQQYPENVEAYKFSADIARFILDDKETAFNYCNQLLQVNPDFGPAWNLVGYYQIDKGNLQEAKAAFDNYLRLNPEEANAHDSMGDFYLAAKQYDQAATHFEKAVAMGMDVSRERAEKARAMAQSGAGESDIEK